MENVENFMVANDSPGDKMTSKMEGTDHKENVDLFADFGDDLDEE